MRIGSGLRQLLLVLRFACSQMRTRLLTPSVTVAPTSGRHGQDGMLELTEIAAVVTAGMKTNMAPALLRTRTLEMTKKASSWNCISPSLQAFRKDPKGGCPGGAEDTKALT